MTNPDPVLFAKLGVIAVVASTLWVGAIVLGKAYNLILAGGLIQLRV